MFIKIYYELCIKIKKVIEKRFQMLYNKLYMYKNITKPGVLLEVGFISNANDRYKLKKEDYQERIANVIANAIIKYFNL